MQIFAMFRQRAGRGTRESPVIGIRGMEAGNAAEGWNHAVRVRHWISNEDPGTKLAQTMTCL